MTDEEAQEFARDWIAAWNDRDLERILSHFADDVLFTSQVAAEVVAGSGGVVRGKTSLRSYWTQALRLNQRLHFDLIGVYRGVDTLVIHFRNQDNVERCEVLTFNAGRIQVGHGTDPAQSGQV